MSANTDAIEKLEEIKARTVDYGAAADRLADAFSEFNTDINIGDLSLTKQEAADLRTFLKDRDPDVGACEMIVGDVDTIISELEQGATAEEDDED